MNAGINYNENECTALPAVLEIALNALVILTMNLWSDAGLYNGAKGKVIDIIWHEKDKNKNMPSVIYVEFPSYTGPPFFLNCP